MTDTSSELLLDFTPSFPCEGEYHTLGVEGHVADEPGAFFLVSPCGNAKLVQCKGRIDFLRKLRYLKCLKCNQRHHIDDYQISPIR